MGKRVNVVVDRPLGSKHPVQNYIYPVNLGRTFTEEGDTIDAYVLGVFEPITEYKGIVIGIIERTDLQEPIFVVAESLNRYSKEQIKALTEFQEGRFNSTLYAYDYLKASIRNTVRVLIKVDEKVLVLEENDPNQTYYHLPGGGIEFLEETHEALIREVKEELGCAVKNYTFYKTISNIFEVDGMNAHEIVQVYTVELMIDPRKLDGNIMTGDLNPSRFRLIHPDVLKSGKIKFYPKELLDVL